MLNIFKKEKPRPRHGEGGQAKVVASSPPKAEKRLINEAWKVLKAAHVAEKASGLAEKNQYVFRVFQRANKFEIKRAVGNVYGVDVINVKIINIPAKKRRMGTRPGFRKAYKKAIVKVKDGQKIDLMPR